MNDKKIRDTFLNYQSHYLEINGDHYTATQMAAIATENDFGITQEKLMKILYK